MSRTHVSAGEANLGYAETARKTVVMETAKESAVGTDTVFLTRYIYVYQ